MEQEKNYLVPSDLIECLSGISSIHGVYKALKSHNIETIVLNNKRKIIPADGVRKLFSERGFIYPNMTISFQIVKGGVGKTSLSFCLATRASHYGCRVLAIDLDQQGNLTRSFNVTARDLPVWINLFRDETPVEESLIKINENLDLIPSNMHNSRLDVELTLSNSSLKDLISNIIDPIRHNYDLVIIDCPPAINKINTAVTCASDLVIIPINPDPYAMDGLDFTIAELNRIKKEFKLDVDYNVIWNKYDARERLGAIYMHELTQKIEILNKIIPVVCRIDASMKNAVFSSQSVFEMPKKSFIQEDIDQFTKEILGINRWKDNKAA